MDEKKDLTGVNLNAEADEIRGEIASYTVQLDTAQDSVRQAEADRREARAAYNEALDAGDTAAMDRAISKLAAAAEIIQSPPAGIEGILPRVEEFHSRQQRLIGEARRRKAKLEAEIAELTKQLPGAEGVTSSMSALAVQIGRLAEKIKDLFKKNDKEDKK